MILLKKLPQRTCMGCNSKKFKKDLIRVVKNKDNQIKVTYWKNTGIIDILELIEPKNEELIANE